MVLCKTIRRFLFAEAEGSSLVELALMSPMLFLMLAGAVDFGRAYSIAIDLSSAAQAGAMYGVQNPTDLPGMINASQAGGTDLTGFAATATYGCECPDGSSAVPSCTAPPSCPDNYVNYVDVKATAPYVPIISLPGFSAGTFKGEARMRVGGD